MNYEHLFKENCLAYIAFATLNREKLLIDNLDLFMKSFKEVHKKYKFKVIAYTLRPEIVYCIIRFENISEFPDAVRGVKSLFTECMGLPPKSYGKIWQNRYWQHTIKDVDELKLHLDYLHFAPVKFGCVDNAKDWKYSSFHKFVRMGVYDINWGSLNSNFEHLEKLRLE